MVYGYMRVSTKDQNLARQYEALREFEIPEKQLFSDMQSGKDFQRPAYQKMLKRIKKGDVVVIKSIDRLGRNYEEILEQWRVITKVKQADLVVLDMPLLDTRVKNGDLTGTFISDLVLQILAYVAQTEREFIRKRQAEGIKIAKENGVHFGPNPKELPEDIVGMKEKWQKGEITLRKAGESLGISYSSFYRYCKKNK